eukprot:maker-scaffold984_size73453-snap-gene-0.17 protein:Tk09992 transcript:maker-scaffold984_size73453-snap-gene-0.17-mRNA-1 annotation:"hypothetical protein OXYTRI_06834"
MGLLLLVELLQDVTLLALGLDDLLLPLLPLGLQLLELGRLLSAIGGQIVLLLEDGLQKGLLLLELLLKASLLLLEELQEVCLTVAAVTIAHPHGTVHPGWLAKPGNLLLLNLLDWPPIEGTGTSASEGCIHRELPLRPGGGLIMNASKTQLMLGGKVRRADLEDFHVLVDGVTVFPDKNIAYDERRRATELAETSQGELEALRDDLTGQMARLRVEYDEKVEDLENRLQVALGVKLEHMMALRDEVEQEYADRMDDLRNMYRDEMDSQSQKFDQEKAKLQGLEVSLQESLKTKRKELDELKVRASESAAKVSELTTRLENQTLEVMRLQTELEEYEYEDAVAGGWE